MESSAICVFPNKEDIELFQLSQLTNGAVRSNYGAFFYAQSQKTIELCAGSLKLLGVPLPNGIADTPHIREIEPIRERVISGIQKRSTTAEFIHLWGMYRNACAEILPLVASDKIDLNERRNIKKNMPRLVERLIFAFWMKEHWIEGKRVSKADAQYALADAVQHVIDTKISYPEWKQSALQKMVSDEEIKRSIGDLKQAEIEKLVTQYANYRHLFEI